MFRYVRALVNWLAHSSYKATPIPLNPPFDPSDLTVVIPTTSLQTPTLHAVVRSILPHPVHTIIITAAGPTASFEISPFQAAFTDPRILIIHQDKPNRRQQTAAAMSLITTPLLLISDDHTFWPTTPSFLPTLLAPFTSPTIGAVAPVLSAIHDPHPTPSWAGFWNAMGCLYLWRRTHEFLATNTLDRGVSCLSSRFFLIRTAIYADPAFLAEYLNEYVFWGRVGPLNVDDDKFHTRWLATQGWDVKIQYTEECVLDTELGKWPKFADQVLRWNRTTWRSNPRALFTERSAWRRFPWTTYAVLMYSFARFTLFYEVGMAWLLDAGLRECGLENWCGLARVLLVVWIVGMKGLKVEGYFRRYPADLVYAPGYLLFGWMCTFVKVLALLTCWNKHW
ncbi:glycosyltransferase family 2 protein, partial [Lophiostoma macrostomum CBS 122681]